MTPRERIRYLRRIGEARRLGRDQLEYLDYWTMLLTDQRARQVRSQALHVVADLVEQAGAGDILTWYGSGANETALDMQRAIVNMIRAQARKEVP